MTLRSPFAVTLWELWRVTRAEAAWKLALPLAGGLAALGLAATFAPPGHPANQDVNDNVAALALILIVVPHLTGWLSIAKLNGGRPGFPLYLAYTRPVRTVLIVAVPMAYLTAMSTAIYLLSAVVLRVASGHAFPLLPVAAWMAALTMLYLAAAWSTRNGVLQVLVTMCAVVKAFVTAQNRLTAVEIEGGYDWPPHLWPTLFDWPRTDYAWIGLIGLASFGIAVVMVARQRRGDTAPVQPVAFTSPWAGLRDRLVSRLRLPCPTSSAGRAQVWLDLKSSGLPVLTVGVALATVILLVSAVSGPIDAAWNADPDVPCPIRECFYARAWPPLLTPVSLFIVLLLGGNAFGIRRRQGRAYVGAFETTQAYGTAQLAILKVLVKSACLLTALLAIGLSVWASVPLLGDGVFIQMWNVPLNSRRSAIGEALAALTAYEQLALAVVATVAVVAWVASWAALGALWTRYPRRARTALSILLAYGIALFLLALARRWGAVPVGTILKATSWAVAAAFVFATAYLAWRTFAERLLTAGHATGVVLVSTAFAAAWLTVLRAAGLSPADMTVADGVRMLWPALLPLTLGVLTPWSYSRIRHT